MIPDFLAKSLADQDQLGESGADSLLDAGRKWDLAPVLQSGGSIIFPHATIGVCGHQIAASVHACLDCGFERVVVLGVLHATTAELKEARTRAAAGGDCAKEPSCGIQGPGIAGREDWRSEFSLLHFQFLWRRECDRRGIEGPELTFRYPFLACGKPDHLPGIDRLRQESDGAPVIVTMDPFHHGIGYGDSVELARSPEDGGLDRARLEIGTGFDLLKSANYPAFEQHCIATKSDGKDVGQALRLLRGPMNAEILDLLADDMAPVYEQPPPTWVAGALIALRPDIM